MLFWLACEELKQEQSSEGVEEKARLIYEDYISILSPKEVTIYTFFVNNCFTNVMISFTYTTGVNQSMYIDLVIVIQVLDMKVLLRYVIYSK
jgi:hypothetical protein